jgi:hypothetical protein
MAAPISPVLAAALAALALVLPTPAAAQVPPYRGDETSGVPPMPTPPPVQTTPPDVTRPASVSAWQPPTDTGAVSPAASSAVATRPPGPAPEVMSTAPAAAATDRPPRRLWSEDAPLFGKNSRVGAYIAPNFKVTGFGRAPGLLLGADFAISINDRFYIGAAGSALVTPLPAQRSDGRTFNLRIQYVGVTLAIALLRVRFFSLGIGSLIGGGRACMNDERLDRCVNRAAMFIAEPELSFSFSLTKSLRLVLSGGYRVVVTQPWSGPNNRLLGGPTGMLSLRLGKF